MLTKESSGGGERSRNTAAKRRIAKTERSESAAADAVPSKTPVEKLRRMFRWNVANGRAFPSVGQGSPAAVAPRHSCECPSP